MSHMGVTKKQAIDDNFRINEVIFYSQFSSDDAHPSLPPTLGLHWGQEKKASPFHQIGVPPPPLLDIHVFSV